MSQFLTLAPRTPVSCFPNRTPRPLSGLRFGNDTAIQKPETDAATDTLIQALQFRQNPYVLMTSVFNTMVAAVVGPILGHYMKAWLDYRSMYAGIITELKPKDIQQVSFDDVIGQPQAKKIAHSIVKRMINPDIFAKYFESDPRGKSTFIVMEGLPGTGKTHLFKAMASTIWKNKGDVAVFMLDCDKLTGNAPGIGPRAIQQLTSKINKSHQKNVLIFMDEVDSLGARNTPNLSQDRRDTINAFLKMTEGLSQFKDKNVFWIAATNEYESLDTAIHSRLDRRITMEPPGKDEIKALYLKYLNDKNLEIPENLDWEPIIKTAEGMVGRDIEKVAKQLKEDQLDALDPEEERAAQQKEQTPGKTGSVKEKIASALSFTNDQLLTITKAIQRKKIASCAPPSPLKVQ